MTHAVYQFDRIKSASPVMREVIEKLKVVSEKDVTVLIQGESGTGKELAARAIHYNSPRKNKEFVIINCSAFSDSLLESELFGYMKGSFTGAITEKKGLFEIADEGTFFLDEIGDMSPMLQVKLLRVLQEGTFLKVGGVKPIKVNVRIVAASNKNLKDMINRGDFREDLYYRINVMKADLPPLRKRKEDLPIIVEDLLGNIAKANNEDRKDLDPEVFEFFQNYDWPGNIRELSNVVEHAAIMTQGKMIHMSQLPQELIGTRVVKDQTPKVNIEGLSLKEAKKKAADAVERVMIEEELVRTNWNKSRAARNLQISRMDLIRKINKYGFEKSPE